ncbi:MAG: GIY-YIG nuclease family protein [Bacteriodetes bacterium]|nr:GIY-YIG nuclease family protein [Bacteroidota bacterium]
MSKVSVYRLLDSNRKILYYGMTNNVKRRTGEHKRDGKKFSAIEVVSTHASRQAAKKAEGARMTKFKQLKGRRPRYNKTNLGDKLG